MKTLLPSGVSMCPDFAIRLKVCVEPDTVPGLHTMPIGGAPGGNASACSEAGSRTPAASTSAMLSPRIRRAMLPVFVLIVFSWSDIGLAHDGLGGKRVLVHPHLGHHSAWSRC